MIKNVNDTVRELASSSIITFVIFVRIEQKICGVKKKGRKKYLTGQNKNQKNKHLAAKVLKKQLSKK